MRKICVVGMTVSLIAFSFAAFAKTSASQFQTLESASQSLGVKSSPVSDDDDDKNFKWANGTITNWDPASKTFVLRTQEGGKKKRVVNETFSWNEKTTVEGAETKVGQRAKVKFTKKKDGTMIAHHVFIGKRAINSHKEEKS